MPALEHRADPLHTHHAQVDDVEKREEQLQASYLELLDERDRLYALVHPEAEGNGGAAAMEQEG